MVPPFADRPFDRLQRVRFQPVIGIDEDDPIRSRSSDAAVLGGSRSGLGLPFDADLVAKSPEFLGCSIRRTVINDRNRIRDARLRQDTFDAFRHPGGAVVRRDHDPEGRAHRT
jgi:hypothetical protein